MAKSIKIKLHDKRMLDRCAANFTKASAIFIVISVASIVSMVMFLLYAMFFDQKFMASAIYFDLVIFAVGIIAMVGYARNDKRATLVSEISGDKYVVLLGKALLHEEVKDAVKDILEEQEIITNSNYYELISATNGIEKLANMDEKTSLQRFVGARFRL